MCGRTASADGCARGPKGRRIDLLGKAGAVVQLDRPGVSCSLE